MLEEGVVVPVGQGVLDGPPGGLDGGVLERGDFVVELLLGGAGFEGVLLLRELLGGLLEGGEGGGLFGCGIGVWYFEEVPEHFVVVAVLPGAPVVLLQFDRLVLVWFFEGGDFRLVVLLHSFSVSPKQYLYLLVGVVLVLFGAVLAEELHNFVIFVELLLRAEILPENKAIVLGHICVLGNVRRHLSRMVR
jgi:hypothetical protein